MINNFDNITRGLDELNTRIEELKEFDRQWKEILEKMKNQSRTVCKSSILLFDFYERDKFNILILDLHSIMGKIFTKDFLSSIFSDIPNNEDEWKSWSQKRLKNIDKLNDGQQYLGAITLSKDQIAINSEIKKGKSILEEIFNNDEYEIKQLICHVQSKREELSRLRNLYAHKYDNKIDKNFRSNLSIEKVESILSWYKKVIENIILWTIAGEYHNDTPSSTDIKDHVQSILDLILTGSSKEIYEAKNCNRHINYDDWRENLIIDG